MQYKIILILLLLGSTEKIQAQQDSLTGVTHAKTARWWHKFRPDSIQKWNFSIVPVPILTSSPETGLKGGMALNYFFNAGDKDTGKLKSRDSYMIADVEYSSRKQLFTELFAQVYTRNERYFLRGRTGYSDNYERIWGFGNFSVPKDSFQNTYYSRWHAQFIATRQLRKNVFAGLRTNFSAVQKVRTEVRDTNLLSTKSGRFGSVVNGIGPTLILDFRDHPLGPEKGWYAEFAHTMHGHWLGGTYTFSETLIDLRKYFTSGRQTLAFQGFAQFTGGEVPWRELPRLGNSTIMRGYFNGRFRGDEYTALQTEYRYRIHRFVGLALFAAAGQVQNSLSGFSLQEMKTAAGAGLRFYASQKKRITLRLDYGITSDNTRGFYIKIGEAF